jgi:hypothetical protein
MTTQSDMSKPVSKAEEARQRCRARARALFGRRDTMAARRLREIAENLAQRWGGLDKLNEAAFQAVNACAAIALKCEIQQAAIRNLQDVDLGELEKATTALTRNLVRLEQLQAIPKGKRAPRSLAEALQGAEK